MSTEEREAIAGPRAKKMEEDRKTKRIGAHTCANKAFNDINTTLARVETTVSTIYRSTRELKRSPSMILAS